MSDQNTKSLEGQIELISKLLSLAFRLGALIGGAVLLAYCYRIEYLPVGVSVGDGFLFLLMAASFGFVYGLYVVSLTALGVCFMPLLRVAQQLLHKLRKRFTKRRLDEPLDLVSPNMYSFIFGLFGIYFIYWIAKVEFSALWNLPLAALLGGVMYSGYQKISCRLDELANAENSPIESTQNSHTKSSLNKDLLLKGRAIALLVIIMLPIMVGVGSGMVLDSGMEFANIRKSNSYVLVRSPYSALLPSKLRTDLPRSLPDFTAFSAVDVVFTGIGQKTVIEFSENERQKRIELPSDHVLVIPR